MGNFIYYYGFDFIIHVCNSKIQAVFANTRMMTDLNFSDMYYTLTELRSGLH